MARVALLCLASLLATGVIAGPVTKDFAKTSEQLERITKCADKDNIFKSGQIYTYKYFGKAETGLGFGDAKSVGLAVDCVVELSVPEPCEYNLKVSSCDIFESEGDEDDTNQEGFETLEDEVIALAGRDISRRGYRKSEKSREFSDKLARFPLLAQAENGEIRRIAYEDEEDVWAVNFKKAILDALHVRGDAESQRDALVMQNSVHGLCPTKYSDKTTRDEIVELKDLDACIQRSKEHWQLSPLTPFWNMSMLSYAMDSESACQYKLERSGEQHIRLMNCRESHRFVPLPWSSHIAAATVNITQHLEIVSKRSGVRAIDRSLATKTLTTVLYEHESSTDVDRKDTTEDADDLLKELVEQAKDGLDLDAPRTFDDFVDELRDADKLDNLLQYVKGLAEREKEIAKYFLVQGLVQCNAPACIRSLTDLMASKEIPEEVFGPVVMGLALTNNQDPLFLEEVKRMCEKKPTRSCALLVGALAYKMVDQDEGILEEKESAEPIENAARFLVGLIEKNKCDASNVLDLADEDGDATKLIIALKAIGNLGSVAQELDEDDKRRTQADNIDAEEKIALCLEDKTVPSNVTIAAIHAYRRFVPTQFIKDKLLAALDDESKSLEVRMSACMATVRVADDRETVRKILKVLEEETSDQVKVFMTKHLRNVMKSEDPNYKEVAKHIKAILEEKGQKLPETQARIPYSVHVELSKFYQVPFLDDEENDFGVQAEGSIMFTTKSYLPQSVHVNVSGQAWGDYINMVEFGADMDGIEDLVEKVVGPRGLLTRSKLFTKLQETASRLMRAAEKMGYKYLKLENIKNLTDRLTHVMKTQNVEQIQRQVLRMIQGIDTTELQRLISQLKDSNMEELMGMLKKYLPKADQAAKIFEKLKRIQKEDLSEETLIQIFESSGVARVRVQELIRRLNDNGVDVSSIIRFIRQTDLANLKDKILNLKVDQVQQALLSALQKVKQATDRFNIPDISAVVRAIEQYVRNPSEISKLSARLWESGLKLSGQYNPMRDDDDDDEQIKDEEGDEESLAITSWGQNVKNMKRAENDDDDEDFDITVFLRVLGHELGFVSASDIMSIDLEQLKNAVNWKAILDDILDGFEIQPTFAGKTEAVHHISTGLGLPLEMSLNITGITTVHIKMQSQGSLLRSLWEVEPSGALQVVGAMAINIPSMHSIAVVANTTVKSEIEAKLRIDVSKDAIEVEIQKPDEELDLIQIRHEIKLVKDEDEYEPFEQLDTDQIDIQKCLPEFVERVTGLKVCADIDSSKLKNLPVLSVGPHELRISMQESQQSGLQHMKMFARRERQAQHNRFEFGVRAPGHQSQREARAVLLHDRERDQLDFNFDMPEQSFPRLRLFARKLSERRSMFGAEAGLDVEYQADEHYNASITALYEYAGYDLSYGSKRVVDAVKDLYLNYTVKASVQTPFVVLNASSTMAKLPDQMLMEHNFTSWISQAVQLPYLQKIQQFATAEENGLIKVTFRHGLKVKSDAVAHDVRAFFKVLAFPESLAIAEPVFVQIAQLKVHRDYRHIGMHFNNTLLNEGHEMEFLNVSASVNDIQNLRQLEDPTTAVISVRRNDWTVQLETEVDKEGTEYSLKHELTAESYLAKEHEHGWKAARLTVVRDLQNLFNVVKSLKNGVQGIKRQHMNHQLRQAGKMIGDSSELKTVKVTFLNQLKEKTERMPEAGLYEDKISRQGARTFVVKSRLAVEGQRSEINKEFRATTLFGNDAADTNDYLSLWIMHNSSATNIPFSVDHFARLLINKPLRDGIVLHVNSSIDNEDDKIVEINTGFQIIPSQRLIQGDLQIDTPVFDVQGDVEMTDPSDGLLQIKLSTKTDSTIIPQYLNHELKSKLKIVDGKVTTGVIIRHPKIETTIKTELDMFDDESADDEQNLVEFEIDSAEITQSSRRPNPTRKSGEDFELSQLTVEKIKETILSLKPELTTSIHVQSKDTELFPSLKIDSSVTALKTKIDARIQSLPQAWENLITVKQYSVIGEIAQKSASLKLQIAGRGEAIMEAVAQDDRKVVLKIYDRGLTQFDKHVEVTLELPTEESISAKIYVNPEAASKLAMNVLEKSKQVMKASQRLVQEKSQKVVREVTRIWSDESHAIYKVIGPLTEGSLKNTKDKLIQIAKKYQRDYEEFVFNMLADLSEFKEQKDAIVRSVKLVLKQVAEKVHFHEVAARLSPVYQGTVRSIKQLAVQYFPEQQQMIEQRKDCLLLKSCDVIQALEAMQQVTVDISKSVNKQQFEQLKQKVTDLAKTLMLNAVGSLKEQAQRSETLKTLLSTMNINDLERRIRNAEAPDLEDVLAWTRSALVMAKSLMVDNLESVVETRDGAVVVTINHPFQWGNFKTLPQLGSLVRSRGVDLMTGLKSSQVALKSKFESAKKLMKNGMPFQTGVVFGDRHVMTFDGKVYAMPETDEDCVHLLVRGVKRQNFALVRRKDGVTLTVPEMVISIDYDNKVRVNESAVAVELPVQSMNKRTQVKLIGDTVQVESQTGILLECRGSKKTCVIHISTEMWDETIGLLGTNDNEADNDFETLDGKQAATVEEFVNEFEVSKKYGCRSWQRSGSRAAQCPKSVKCAALFRNTDSELSSCFQAVDPAEFLQACEDESKQCDRKQAEEAVCDIVNAYRAVCLSKSVETEVPEACETCEGRKENSQWSGRGNNNQVDLVVVVSEHKDMAENAGPAGSKIRKITSAVVEKLQQYNSQDVRVALVGYSGAGAHKEGHTHTIEQKQFGVAESFSKALKTLEFKGSNEIDVLDALEFVLESHDFRAQATKLMLVFDHTESEHISGHSQFQKIKEKLVELGVTMTVFSDYDDLKEQHLGVNYDGNLFLRKAGSSRVQGEMPEMELSRLAKASRGAIFQLDALTGDASKESRLQESAVETVLRQVQGDSKTCKTCVCRLTELKQLTSACKVTAC